MVYSAKDIRVVDGGGDFPVVHIVEVNHFVDSCKDVLVVHRRVENGRFSGQGERNQLG